MPTSACDPSIRPRALGCLGLLLILSVPTAPPLHGQEPPGPDPDRIRASGEVEGREMAAEEAVLEWGGWGFAGGTLLGPVGVALVTVRAGRADAEPGPALDGLDDPDPAFLDGFQRGYRKQLTERRREAALVGGMVGSAVFVFALIQLIDLSGEQEGPGPGPTDPPFIRIPVSLPSPL